MRVRRYNNPNDQQESYESSRAKNVAHSFLTDAVLEKANTERPEIRKLNILSFPGTSFRWEATQHELLEGEVNLTGLEAVPMVFDKGCRLRDALDLPMDYHQMSDLDFWKKVPKQQDVVWLDYCGPWSKLKAEAIETMFAQDRLRFGRTGPILALTVMDGMDLRSIGSLMLLANARKQFKARVGGIPRWIDSVAQKHGRSAELKFLLHYRDCLRTPRAKPMLLFILQLHLRVIKFDVWKAETMDLLQDRLSGMTERVKR